MAQLFRVRSDAMELGQENQALQGLIANRAVGLCGVPVWREPIGKTIGNYCSIHTQARTSSCVHSHRQPIDGTLPDPGVQQPRPATHDYREPPPAMRSAWYIMPRNFLRDTHRENGNLFHHCQIVPTGTAELVRDLDAAIPKASSKNSPPTPHTRHA
jgi:hypothetical protein